MGLSATALSLLVALLHGWTVAVHASHVVYPELQSLEAEQVDETSRTGYHFQPPKHWINGILDCQFGFALYSTCYLSSN